jgi:hypothetical protein
MAGKEICRVVTFEWPTGTYYHAQRRVWKKGWFAKEGRWEWEAFSMRQADMGGVYFSPLRGNIAKTDKIFKDKSNAEWYCEEWVRMLNSGKPIKVWSEEE